MATRFLLLIFIFLSINNEHSFAQDLRTLYQESIAAYKDKDYQKFKDLNNQALQLHPSYPALLYNQVSAFALNNEKENAANALIKLLTWNSALKFEEEADFITLMNDLELKQLLQNQRALYSQTKETSSILATIPGNFHFEDVLYVNGILIMTDVYHGKVIAYDVKQKIITGKIQLNGSGMAVTSSEDVNSVWVSSSMMVNFINYNDELEHQAFLYKINFKKNIIEDSIELDSKAVIGSMEYKDGLLYATNSITPEVYVYDTKKKKIIDIWKIDGAFNLQGITVKNDFIYLADYIRGIARIGRHESHVVNWLDSPEYLLKGIDGLHSTDKNTLIAIQNNATPKRVVKIGHDGSSVQSVEILDNGIFKTGEPTNGYFDKNLGYIYIANSPWAYYDKKNNPSIAEWKKQEIRVLSFK